MTRYSIPRRIVLPFGWVIRVAQVSRTANALFDGDDNSYLDGRWDDLTRTIYINRDAPVKRRRHLLLHELDHAINDLMHWAGDQKISDQ